MPINNINIGTSANSGTGEGLRLGGQKINANFAYIKQYADNLIQGLKWKQKVDVGTTANITLSGEQTIDGFTTNTSRILVKDQTDKTQNGIYVTGAGAWARSTDADTGDELENATVSVASGNTQSNTNWTCNNSAIILGSSSIEFVDFVGNDGVDQGTFDAAIDLINTRLSTNETSISDHEDRITVLESLDTTGNGDPQQTKLTSFTSGALGGLDFQPYATWLEDSVAKSDSPSVPITASTGDVSNDRFDRFVIDLPTEQIVLIEGTPSANPLIPEYDPATQLDTGVVIRVNANQTTVDGAGFIDVWTEGAEWATTGAGPDFDLANTESVDSGTYAIKTVNPLQDNQTLPLIAPSPVDITTVESFQYKIKNITGGAHRILLRGERSNGRTSSVFLDPPNYDPNNTTDYQFITAGIPQSNLVNITSVYIVSGFTGFEYYLDNVKFVTGVESSPSTLSGQNVIDALGYTPANDSEVVKLSGDQTIDDVKTFSISPKIPDAVNNDEPVSKGQLDTAIAGVGGGSSQPPVENAGSPYLDVSALIADQNNQEQGYEYLITDASGFSTPDITSGKAVVLMTKEPGVDATGTENDYIITWAEQFDVNAGGGSETLSRQTVITANTTLDGSETLGLSKYTPINSESDLVVTVDKGTHAVGQVHNFRKNGNGKVAFKAGTDVILEGKRNIDNEFVILNKGNFASLIWDREESGKLIGSIVGDIQGGYIEPTYNQNDIVHYYPLETNSNDSVGTLHGADNNMVYSNGWAVFNGTDSYIDLIDDDSLSFVSGGEDQDFSISFMVNFDTISAAIFLINKFINSSTGEYRVALTNTLDKVILELRDANNSNATISGDAENLTLTTGVDYHITATHQAGINKIYIDAIDETDAQSVFGSYSSMVNNTSPVRIGGRSYETSNMLDGKMWGVAFWDKALSQTEVTAIKTRQKDNGLQLV